MHHVAWLDAMILLQLAIIYLQGAPKNIRFRTCRLPELINIESIDCVLCLLTDIFKIHEPTRQVKLWKLIKNETMSRSGSVDC